MFFLLYANNSFKNQNTKKNSIKEQKCVLKIYYKFTFLTNEL